MIGNQVLMSLQDSKQRKATGIHFDHSMDLCLQREVENYIKDNKITNISSIDWNMIRINFLNKYQGRDIRHKDITTKKLKDRYVNYLRPDLDFTELNSEELSILTKIIKEPIFRNNNRISWNFVAIKFNEYTKKNCTGTFLKNQCNKYMNRLKNPKMIPRNTHSGPNRKP